MAKTIDPIKADLMDDEPERKPSLVVRVLGIAEHGILALVAVALVILSVVLLIHAGYTIFITIKNGDIGNQAVPILDDILLVLMTMEIVYTVTLSIESHRLQAEPFLVIGTIAAIRRILVITAESSQIITQPDQFQGMVVELGLLCLIIIIMASSIFILRRSDCLRMQTKLAMKKQLAAEEEQKKTNDDHYGM